MLKSVLWFKFVCSDASCHFIWVSRWSSHNLFPRELLIASSLYQTKETITNNSRIYLLLRRLLSKCHDSRSSCQMLCFSSLPISHLLVNPSVAVLKIDLQSVHFSSSPLPELSISTQECTPGSSGQDSAEQWMGVCGIASYLPSFLIVTNVTDRTRKTKRANLWPNMKYIFPGNGNGVICIQTHTGKCTYTNNACTHTWTPQIHMHTHVYTHIHFIFACVSSSLNFMLPFQHCNDLWKVVVCSYDNKISTIEQVAQYVTMEMTLLAFPCG